MIRLLLISFLLIFSLKAGIINDYKKNKRVVVVYGEKATEAEVKAAKEIYNILELGNMDSLYDHIITDVYALKHQFFYSSFHLIIVGSPKTNQLFKNNSEIQVATPEKNSSQLRILPKLNNTGNGIFGARFGYYPNPKGIGYIRRILNPFTLQSFNLTKGKVNSGPYTATYLGGTDAQGIIDAYVNFLDMGMMEGALIPEELLAEKNSRFRLSKENVKTDILEKIDKSIKVRLGQDILEYKGWIQGAVSDYAGIKRLSSKSAQQIIHLKFAAGTPQLMTHDDQVNTLLMVKFKSEQESLDALKGLDQSLKLALQIKPGKSQQIYPCGGGGEKFFIIREGAFLFIENFTRQWKEPFIKQAASIIKN